MIDREGKLIVFHCDACPDYIETGESNFEKAWEMARGQGWRALRTGSEWLHNCKGCAPVRGVA